MTDSVRDMPSISPVSRAVTVARVTFGSASSIGLSSQFSISSVASVGVVIIPPRYMSQSYIFPSYHRSMTRSHIGRTANLVGALALAITDEVERASEEAAGHGAAAPAALISLDEFANGCSLEHLRQVLGLTHSGG